MVSGAWCLAPYSQDLEDFGFPSHQVGGVPNPVQYPGMGFMCQLVSNGVDMGDQYWPLDPRVSELKKGASDWRLLLQMDTNDELELMWDDTGILHF